MKKKRLLIAIITVLFVVATVIFYNYILKDETEVAIEAYCTFLAGEAYITDEKWGVETRITIAPTEQGKYTLIDMNDDGIPELVTNVITQQLHDICRNASYPSSVAGIYTYQTAKLPNGIPVTTKASHFSATGHCCTNMKPITREAITIIILNWIVTVKSAITCMESKGGKLNTANGLTSGNTTFLMFGQGKTYQ